MARASVRPPVPDEDVPAVVAPAVEGVGIGGVPLDPAQLGADEDGFGGDAPAPTSGDADATPAPTDTADKPAPRNTRQDAVVVTSTIFVWIDPDTGHKHRARKGDTLTGLPADIRARGLRNGALD